MSVINVQMLKMKEMVILVQKGFKQRLNMEK